MFNFLKSVVEYGNPHVLENIRPAAIAALAEFASTLSKRRIRTATEILVDLLREPKSGIKVHNTELNSSHVFGTRALPLRDCLCSRQKELCLQSALSNQVRRLTVCIALSANLH